jgi:transcriptional regulator with XRE-family HTH domain
MSSTEPKFYDTSQEIRLAMEVRRAELGVSQRAVSVRAGYAHASYWWWLNAKGAVSLEAALCYLRALGLRVSLVKDKPLVRIKERAGE